MFWKVWKNAVDKEFLKAGNPRRIIAYYNSFLGVDFSNRIESELGKHVKAIYALAIEHFEFAERQRPSEWRQKVSRYYYACYNASKALRFHIDGNYSSDVSDHKKVGEFPTDFQNHDYSKIRLNRCVQTEIRVITIMLSRWKD